MTENWQPDEADLVSALRADLPSTRDRDRLRARLTAAGVVALGGATPFVVASGTAAASGSVTGTAGISTALVQKFAALSWSSKLVLAAVATASALSPAIVNVVAPLVRVQIESGKSAAVTRTGSTAVQSRTDALPLTAAAPSAEPTPALGVAEVAGPQTASVPAAARAGIIQQRASSDVAKRVPARSGASDVTSAESVSRTSAGPLPAEAKRVGQVDDSASSKSVDVVPAPPMRESTTSDPSSGATPSPTASSRATLQRAPAASAKFYAPQPPSAAGLPRARLGSPAPSALSQETKLIERALAALSVRDVAAARTWLNLHALHYRNGLLRRERERVLARIDRILDGTAVTARNERP